MQGYLKIVDCDVRFEDAISIPLYMANSVEYFACF